MFRHAQTLHADGFMIMLHIAYAPSVLLLLTSYCIFALLLLNKPGFPVCNIHTTLCYLIRFLNSMLITVTK